MAETLGERQARVYQERLAKQTLRRDTREQDPLGHAVLLSTEGNQLVHCPYSAEYADRLAQICDGVERLPQRVHDERDRDGKLTGERAQLSLGSLRYSGTWRGLEPSSFDGKPWRVQLDDVPTDVVSDLIEVP
jgi:hypothetical protein